MKKLAILISLLTLIVSCKKSEERSIGSFMTGYGVFIVNEGKFTAGNGSLSFYSYDSTKIYNDLFSVVNGRPLGDVPNSIQINGDRAYVVVNNSGKIEVINKSNLESVATIAGLISPRNIGFVNSSKAYVTSMYSDSLIILDLNDNSISGYINLRRSSESIIISGDKAYAANWVGGHEVMIIDNSADEVIDSIEVGIEPESMAIDHNNMLWVLCNGGWTLGNGGWTRENFAELDGINTATSTLERHILFPDKLASPTSLSIDGSGETLYYLQSGIRRISITAAQLPLEPYITDSGHNFYKLGINPVNGDIFVTDAVDFQQNGSILIYSADGTLVTSQSADIIPGSVCFKIANK
jgi:hypothetical protein